MKTSYKLDDLDVKILRELQRDARAKVTDLAKKLDMPHSTVYMRMRQLENMGVIEGYKPILNLGKIGRPIMAVVECKMEMSKQTPGEEYNWMDELTKIDNIVSIYTTTGNFDISLFIVGADIKEIDTIISRIRSVPFIATSETNIVLRRFKHRGDYPLE
jgi:DNA-binding Lrp family transcriptional regulator